MEHFHLLTMLNSIFTSMKTEGDITLQGPIYVIHETDKALYFVSKGMNKWFNEFVPINSIKTKDIKYMLSERINDGFPKTKR